jgi:hypothetical protein
VGGHLARPEVVIDKDARCAIVPKRSWYFQQKAIAFDVTTIAIFAKKLAIDYYQLLLKLLLLLLLFLPQNLLEFPARSQLLDLVHQELLLQEVKLARECAVHLLGSN